MRTLRTVAVFFIAGLGLSACAGPADYFSLLSDVGVNPDDAAKKAQEVEDATLGNMAKALPVYCHAPGVARSILRERFNGRPEAKGAQVGAWCPGDPPLTLGAPE